MARFVVIRNNRAPEDTPKAEPIPEIREMCVFSIHDLARDPPFSRLVISCRNLLIYLDTALQNRLVRTFHCALRPADICSSGRRRELPARADFLPFSIGSIASSN